MFPTWLIRASTIGAWKVELDELSHKNSSRTANAVANTMTPASPLFFGDIMSRS